MPSKRPSPIVTVRLLSGGISAEKTSSLSSTLLPVRLRWTTHSFDCQALLDSGAEGNFLDSTFAHKLQIPIKSLTHKISVHALNGHELPTISFTTGPVTLITSGNHTETISFLIMDSPLAPVVLGHPWLISHNPKIDWHQKSIVAWSNKCYESCLVSACPLISVSVFQEEAVDLSNVPAEYRDLRKCSVSLEQLLFLRIVLTTVP